MYVAYMLLKPMTCQSLLAWHSQTFSSQMLHVCRLICHRRLPLIRHNSVATLVNCSDFGLDQTSPAD